MNIILLENYYLRIKRIIYLIVANLLIFPMAEPSVADEFGEGTAYSDAFDHPCSEPGLSAFKNGIYKIAVERQPDDAWKLVYTLLCDKGKLAQQFVYDRLEEKPHYDSKEYYDQGATLSIFPLFKSKYTSDDIKYYMTEGEAYEVSFQSSDIYLYPEYQKAQKPPIYVHSIRIFGEVGRLDGAQGWQYYLSFRQNRWVFTGIALFSD